MPLHVPELKAWAYPLLFATGFTAGLVDSMAGGGGMLTVPVLLNLGLPVPLALGTNKFQASFGSVSASVHYVRNDVVSLRECGLGIVATLIGALAGASCVQVLDPVLLSRLVPWLLAAIVAYAIFKPDVGHREAPPRMGRAPFFVLAGLGLGFYDGFFGPGTGSFWTIALVLLLGQDFMRATGHTKVMNATSNLGSLALFALAGQIALAAGAAMGAGQLVGARIGAGLVVKRGARFVKPLFLGMVALTVLRLLWTTFLR